MRKPKGARPWLWALLVGGAAFVTYVPSLANGFAEDDVIYIEADERIRTWASLPELLFEPYWTETSPERSPYRPVTTLSYLMSWQIGGGHALAFHLMNVLAHVAAALLLMSVLTRLGVSVAVASLASLVFAVHPVHVEAVANIVGRADVLMALFCLVGVRVWLATNIPAWARLFGVALAYLLAIGAKENGYVLPLLILLVELIRPQLQGLDHVSEPGSAVPGGVRSTVRTLATRAWGCWPVLAAMTLVLAGYLCVRTAVLGAIVHLDVAAYIAILPPGMRQTTAVANLTEVARASSSSRAI